MDDKSGILELREREHMAFIKRKEFSPLIYLDVLKISGYHAMDKPRVEAYWGSKTGYH